MLVGELSKGILFRTSAAFSRDRSRPDTVLIGVLREGIRQGILCCAVMSAGARKRSERASERVNTWE